MPLQLAGLPDAAVGGGQPQVPPHHGSSPSQSLAARPLLTGDPGVLDMGAVDVHVMHGRGDPGMPKVLLDRDQVHPAQVELAGAEVAQDVRGEPCSASAGRCDRRPRPARPAASRRRPGRRYRRRSCVRSGNSGAPGRVWSSSKWPHTSSTNQRSVCPASLISGTIRSRGPRPAGALAVPDVQLAEPAQLPLHVGQVEAGGPR